MDAPSPFQETIFTQGTEVGELARTLFPEGELIHEDHRNPEGALAHTQEAIASGRSAIFEAALKYEDVLIRADVIKRNDDGSWDLLEVKSTSSVKKEHLHDAAIQKYVLSKLGLGPSKTCLMHLNKTYVRNGALNLQDLFQITQIDELIADTLKEVPEYLEKIRHALGHDSEPEQMIHSSCKSPYTCEFKSHCWKDVGPKSIHYLYRINDDKRFKLLHNGVELTTDIPADFKLSDLQLIQVKCERDDYTEINQVEILKHLNGLKFPLHFLDFETYGYAVPAYPGTRPYLQLPFQYSLHIQEKPTADFTHFEFLHRSKSDPRRSLAEKMISQIGAKGSVVVYHKSAEGGRIQNMIDAFPDLAPQLQSILDRLWDMELPFAKRWYCDPTLQGSSSIKKVLPALVPELSYEGLEINKGDLAQMRYMEMIELPTTDPMHQKIANDLLTYCKLDTWAMVKILEALRTLVGGKPIHE